MHFRRSLGLVALLAVSCSVGCSMTNPTIRGQSPAVQVQTPANCPPGGEMVPGSLIPGNTGPIVGTAPGYGEFVREPYLGRHGKHDFRVYSQFYDNNLGYGNGYYNRPEAYIGDFNAPYTIDGSGCPQCQFGRACPAGGCKHCGCGYRCGMPQHYQTYQFNWPQNMVYPQQGAPLGMVQYPYYTLRGPTDFFMN